MNDNCSGNEKNDPPAGGSFLIFLRQSHELPLPLRRAAALRQLFSNQSAVFQQCINSRFLAPEGDVHFKFVLRTLA